MNSFVPRFIAGEFDQKFGSWRDNVLSWVSLRGENPNFMMLRYEEMKRDDGGSASAGRCISGALFIPED